LNRRVGNGNGLGPASNSASYRFLGGRLRLSDALWRGLDVVCGFDRPDLLGQFRSDGNRSAVPSADCGTAIR
jgi:hypothetical protein